MEELLNERDSTSKMPQMWGELLCSAQPLPQLRDTSRVAKHAHAVPHPEHSEGHCGL